MSHSTAEAGELSPRDPVEGRGHRQVAPVEGKTANTPRLGPVSTSRQRIAELARQALGMAVAIAWLPGPTGTRRRVAKPSVEEPDAAEPARPDLWGARVSNDPGLPDRVAPEKRETSRPCSAADNPFVGQSGVAPEQTVERETVPWVRTPCFQGVSAIIAAHWIVFESSIVPGIVPARVHSARWTDRNREEVSRPAPVSGIVLHLRAAFTTARDLHCSISPRG